MLRDLKKVNHSMDDLRAIQLLKKGDISGLELLIERYQVKAIRVAFLITRDEALAEDVVQDTYLRIHHRIRSFDETRPFEPYFLSCVTHAAIDAAERASRHILLDEGDPGQFDRLLQRASSTEDKVEYSQLREEIFDCLGKLAPRERAVIIQRYYLDMSEKEMAAEHSVAPGTVKWLLNSARRHLRSFIGMEGENK
jgi:RNA polymerase sigma-70 factor (ECF subfamily)